MKTVYFVRHAQSQANVDGLMAGSEFETPLTKDGENQAKEAGEYLKNKGIEVIVCSPMKRTVKTAQIIAKEIGYDAKKIVTNPLLTERGLGYYSGKPFEEFLNDQNSGHVVDDDMESFEALHDRVQEAFRWLRSLKQDTILVVSHGATGRMFRVVDRELAQDDFHQMERFDNCEVDEFTL